MNSWAKDQPEHDCIEWELQNILKKAKTDFQIFGQVGNTWLEFEKDVAYESFLVKSKKQ